MTTDLQTKGRLLADRIRTVAMSVSNEMDTLAERVEDTEKAIPTAFNRAHAFLDHQQQEVTAIDDVLRSLSNLPLAPGASGGVELPTLPITLPVTSAITAPAGTIITAPMVAAPVIVEMKPAPGSEALPSGIPANIAAALQLNKTGE